MKRRYSSPVAQAVHDTASGLYEAGAISGARLREYDVLCLESRGTERLRDRRRNGRPESNRGAKFELISKHGRFHFNLKAGNGQIVLTSESYQSLAQAQGGIEFVRRNAAMGTCFQRLLSAAGAPYFVLIGRNQEIFARSETYSTNAAMEGGIKSVRRNAPIAPIVRAA